MHVVTKIFFLTNIVAIASCGTMPVPDIGVGSSSSPASSQIVTAKPKAVDSAVENETNPTKPTKQQGHDTKPSTKKDALDTSYLADVTNSQELNKSTTTTTEVQTSQQETSNRSKASNQKKASASDSRDLSVTGNTTNSVQDNPKSFNAVLAASGITDSSENQKSSSQKVKPLTGENNPPQKTKVNKPVTNNSKTDTSQEVRIQLALAKRYYNSAKYQNAIDLLETPASSGKSNEKLRDLLLLSYTKYASELVSRANLLEAQTILEKAVSIEPGNTDLQIQLSKIKNTREANHFYQIGLEAINSGDKIKAFKSFQKVLELNPSHNLANKQVVKIRGSVIESRYKQAMQFYRKQELTDAIRAWDDVLDLDPNHELAKLYRSRAAELKRKIDAINQN